MCVQVTKTANRFEISSLLEKILLKQVRWCLTFVGLYIFQYCISVADKTELLFFRRTLFLEPPMIMRVVFGQ